MPIWSVVEIFCPESHIRNMSFDGKYSAPLVIVRKGIIFKNAD